jgi:uncharacterized cupin superfamily protein
VVDTTGMSVSSSPKTSSLFFELDSFVSTEVPATQRQGTTTPSRYPEFSLPVETTPLTDLEAERRRGPHTAERLESGQILVMRSTLTLEHDLAHGSVNNDLRSDDASQEHEPNDPDHSDHPDHPDHPDDHEIGSSPLPSNVSREAARALDQKLREIEQALKDEAQLLATKATRHRNLIDDSRDDALVGLEPAPLPASWLIEGDPSPRIKIMTCSPEGGLLSGVWTCRAATFRFDYATFDETVHIIRGVAEVRIGNGITYLRPGSIAYFPKGASSEWTVHEPIHKYFVQRNSNRGVRKLRGLMGRFRHSEPGGLG